MTTLEGRQLLVTCATYLEGIRIYTQLYTRLWAIVYGLLKGTMPLILSLRNFCYFMQAR